MARIAALKRDLEGKLVPELEAFFAGLRDRVLERIRRQGSSALSLYIETKQQYPFGPDDLVPDSEDAALRLILRPRILEAMEAAWEATAAEFGIDLAFDVTNPIVRDLLGRASSLRVRAITDATRTAIREALATGAEQGYSLFQLANGVEADGFRGIGSIVEETYRGRADAIARTEMGWGSNQGATALYRIEGIEKVQVFDGLDDDDACRAADGSTWTLAEAEANPLEHPNCRRAFAPLIEFVEIEEEGS